MCRNAFRTPRSVAVASAAQTFAAVSGIRVQSGSLLWGWLGFERKKGMGFKVFSNEIGRVCVWLFAFHASRSSVTLQRHQFLKLLNLVTQRKVLALPR
jgi:hypothetical protein